MATVKWQDDEGDTHVSTLLRAGDEDHETILVDGPQGPVEIWAEMLRDGLGDPCPYCGKLLPDVAASPVVCDECGAEVE